MTDSAPETQSTISSVINKLINKDVIGLSIVS